MSVRSSATKDRLISQVGGMCVYGCGRPADHLDHVMPRARGGGSSLGNLVPACSVCGSSKGCRTVSEWVVALAVRIAAGEPPGALLPGLAARAALPGVLGDGIGQGITVTDSDGS